MGTYYNSIKEGGESGGKDAMWAEVALLDKEIMMPLEQENPVKFWDFMRKRHVLRSGPHYNEDFARYDVSKMFHKDNSGNVIEGERWNVNAAKEAIKPWIGKISQTCTIYDVYVALNTNWHDKVELWKKKHPETYEADIIEDAVSFYMLDDDAKDGKVWNYIQAVAK